jgi:hypothetical protein
MITFDKLKEMMSEKIVTYKSSFTQRKGRISFWIVLLFAVVGRLAPV